MDDRTRSGPLRRRPAARIAAALVVSLLVHVAFVTEILRLPAARAAAMQTLPPDILQSPGPIGLITPAPTPRPTPPPPRPTPPPATMPPKPAVALSTSAPAPSHHTTRHVEHAPHVAYQPRSDGPAQLSPHGDPGFGAPSDGVPTIGGPPDAGRAPATVAPIEVPPTASCAVPASAAQTVMVADPELPESARERDETGATRVRVDLDARGDVSHVSVDASSGFSDLDRAALRAAQESRYLPERRDCIAIAGSYLFVATFDQ